ncbi:hypothetical protein AL522_17420 [Pantoea vagans]|nr:hypothetical protein AL522_17420 [Pantoea vagans]
MMFFQVNNASKKGSLSEPDSVIALFYLWFSSGDAKRNLTLLDHILCLFLLKIDEFFNIYPERTKNSQQINLFQSRRA